LTDPDGPVPGFAPPGQELVPNPGQPQPDYYAPPSYRQAPYPGYPAMSGVGLAPPMRRPSPVRFAFWLILLGAAIVAAMFVSAVVIGNDEITQNARDSLAKDGPYTEADVQNFKMFAIGGFAVLVAIPMALIVIFGFVMRTGRNWARVTLTVLLAIGLLPAVGIALAPAYLVVRLLAVLMVPLIAGIIVGMFQPSANPYFDPRARMGGWTT
jgi:hypothetical protein